VSACRLAETFVGARSRAMLSLVSAFGAKSFQGTSFQSRSFRLPAAAEVLLFCLSKREVPKRKRPPAWRLPGIHGRQVRESGPGFSSGLLPARKGVAIPGNARYAAYRPRLTAAQGTPGRAAGHRGPHSVMKRKSRSHSKASLCCGFAPALDLALLKSARWERAALPGAPMARRVGGGKPAGWPAWMPASFSPAQDVLSKNPVAHPRTRRAGCPQGAPSGWPFSWVTFSLATQRESDSVAEGDRPLLILNAAEARASRTSALLQLQARQFSAAAAAKHATGAVA
jgi:hypothetical protein